MTYACPMSRPVPTLDAENELLASGARVVVGIDEVGRGALAGPVMVGAVAVDATTGAVPTGLADSKLMTPKRREAMVPLVEQWCLGWGIGSADAEEIDRVGIMAALGLAASRALELLRVRFDVVPDVVILDGTTSFLVEEAGGPRVTLKAKADQTCASVSAASVIAKVERDALMQVMHARHPHYGWAGNKGYGASVHTEAIRAHGLTDLHRRSWNIG